MSQRGVLTVASPAQYYQAVIEGRTEIHRLLAPSRNLLKCREKTMLETRYRRGIVAAAATALFWATMSPSFATAQPSAVSPPPVPQPVATGDTLIDNYSFESGLAGWSSRSGTDSDEARGVASCTGTASICLLYTSPSPRDGLLSRMPSSA